MTQTTLESIGVFRRIVLVISFIFSLLIAYSIAISVIDNANSRFSAIAFGFSAVMFTSPLAAKACSK